MKTNLGHGRTSMAAHVCQICNVEDMRGRFLNDELGK